jgi:hypothetical protein
VEFFYLSLTPLFYSYVPDFFRASHENCLTLRQALDLYIQRLTIYFMAKKKEIKRIVKLQIVAGSATPAPPIGTAL